MALEDRVKVEPCAGSLSACLVDGNAEQNARARKIKRRALAISISLQTVGLAALVILPIFAKPAELVTRITTPVPPYRSAPKPVTTTAQPPRGPERQICFDCFRYTQSIGQVIERTQALPPGDPGPEWPFGPPNTQGVIPAIDTRVSPPAGVDKTHEKKIVYTTHIDPALLTHRVEPVYPPIARQIRRAGRVELHARIATDGTVQSLQLVSGDAMFVTSAMEAVRQWRYQATMLNGQALEVDTYITVIYTLQQ